LLLAFAVSGLQGPEPSALPGAADVRRAHAVISGRFEPHPARKMESPERRVFGDSARTRSVRGNAGAAGHKGAVMGLGKKAKREAKTVKGKTKKGAGKVKHKGKKAKNAAKH
jgi:hypothetical protein